jgi:hypothetical protein
MAGLVPAIHVLASGKKDVDARHKAGHDRAAVMRICRQVCAIWITLRQLSCKNSR